MSTVVGPSLGAIASAVHKTPPVFPLSIGWAHAFWASDPTWTPPANGAAVSSWRNAGTSGHTATQDTTTAQPTFQAAYANLNGKPAVVFDGTTDYMDTAPASLSMPQPNHVVVVGWMDPTHAATPMTLDGDASFRHMLRTHEASNNALIFAGSAGTATGGGRTGAHVVVALYNGASSAYRMNGTAYTISANIGTQPLNRPRIGAGYNGVAATLFYKGAIAFIGISETALTAQNITDLETWAKSFYGVPIP